MSLSISLVIIEAIIAWPKSLRSPSGLLPIAPFDSRDTSLPATKIKVSHKRIEDALISIKKGSRVTLISMHSLFSTTLLRSTLLWFLLHRRQFCWSLSHWFSRCCFTKPEKSCHDIRGAQLLFVRFDSSGKICISRQIFIASISVSSVTAWKNDKIVGAAETLWQRQRRLPWFHRSSFADDDRDKRFCRRHPRYENSHLLRRQDADLWSWEVEVNRSCLMRLRIVFILLLAMHWGAKWTLHGSKRNISTDTATFLAFIVEEVNRGLVPLREKNCIHTLPCNV